MQRPCQIDRFVATALSNFLYSISTTNVHVISMIWTELAASIDRKRYLLWQMTYGARSIDIAEKRPDSHCVSNASMVQ
jgi:hypothetical protein